MLICPRMLCAQNRVWRSSAGRPMTPPTSARMASYRGRLACSTTSSKAGVGCASSWVISRTGQAGRSSPYMCCSRPSTNARSLASGVRPGSARGIAQDFGIEPQFVAEVIVHRGQIDSGARANVAHLGRLEAGFGEDVPGGFEYPGFSGVCREAVVRFVAVRHGSNSILKHLFEPVKRKV